MCKYSFTPIGVEIHAKSTQTGCSSIFRADAVIVSVPLGVLKANTISFHPPLPEWKTQAISNLGFGLLNKVSHVTHSVPGKWGSTHAPHFMGSI